MSDIDGTVVALQGRDVDSAAPSDGDVLAWNDAGSKWTPTAPPTPALEPWVGSVDTQRQIIKRIPFTCGETGPGWISTGIQYTLPTDSALVLWIYVASRSVSNHGVIAASFVATVANNGGTLTTPDVSGSNGSSVSGTTNGNSIFRLTTSGTTVTLEINQVNADVSWVGNFQGFVDLMSI